MQTCRPDETARHTYPLISRISKSLQHQIGNFNWVTQAWSVCRECRERLRSALSLLFSFLNFRPITLYPRNFSTFRFHPVFFTATTTTTALSRLSSLSFCIRHFILALAVISIGFLNYIRALARYWSAALGSAAILSHKIYCPPIPAME